MKGRTLILASASPRRRQLLRTLRIPFKVAPSRISEESERTAPRSIVLDLALRKARAVAARHQRALVLGADTIVVCQGEILNKPRNPSDARRILRLLNGRWHRVYTGVALVDCESGRSWREAALTRVKARKLPPEELERFVGRHMDKAGAYAVQDGDDPFIERLVGPRDNVVGLPLANVRSLLRRALKTWKRRR
jgi:septum formation protein